MTQYTVLVSGLYMEIIVEAGNADEAMEAAENGFGEQIILWDDAEYSMEDPEEEENQS